VDARLLGLCGPAAFVTFTAGWFAGDRVQPAAFSPANDDISDLGATSAASPWLYDQLAANLSGLLIAGLAVGLWRALAPSRLGRLGAAALFVAGFGMLLDGVFRLDCQGFQTGCRNDSWHAHAHKLESGVTATASVLALVLLAVAFRRLPQWRRAWRAVLAAVPGVAVVSALLSPLGAGTAARAGSTVLLAAFAYVGWRLFDLGGVTSEPARPRRSGSTARRPPSPG
jgi:hypothetical protein